MVRECEVVSLDQFAEDVIALNLNIEIWVDIKNKEEIMIFLEKKANSKRFKRILDNANKNRYPEKLYKNESGVSNKTKNVTAMKFKGKRIFCKEYFVRTGNSFKKVVMMSLFTKKSDKSKKWKSSIENVGGYDYDF